MVELGFGGADGPPAGRMERGVRSVMARLESTLTSVRPENPERADGIVECVSPAVPDTAFRFEARAYFSLLDRRFNARLGQMESTLIGPVRQVWETLVRRLCLRRVQSVDAAAGADLPVHSRPDHVQAISQQMLDTLAEVFGMPFTDADRAERIGAAHDVFSWGGLRLKSKNSVVVRSNTAPDGAAIFLFPEFAQLALQMGFDEDDWTAILPALTRMPALYLRVHEVVQPGSTPRPFWDYSEPPEVGTHGPALVAYANQLAGKYDRLSRAELGAELGHLFLAGVTDDPIPNSSSSP